MKWPLVTRRTHEAACDKVTAQLVEAQQATGRVADDLREALAEQRELTRSLDAARTDLDVLTKPLTSYSMSRGEDPAKQDARITVVVHEQVIRRSTIETLTREIARAILTGAHASNRTRDLHGGRSS